jgi:hypothetical protein
LLLLCCAAQTHATPEGMLDYIQRGNYTPPKRGASKSHARGQSARTQ